MVNKLFFIFLLFIGCERAVTTEQTVKIKGRSIRDALVSAANADGFYLDEQIQNKLERQRRGVLGRLYLENTINRRVSVSMGEVEEYYKKTKSQHLRQSREFLVLRFNAPTLDSAKIIRKKLNTATKTKSSKGLGELIESLRPTRELLDENKIKKEIRSLFLQRRGDPVSVGPVSSRGQHAVFHLLNTYEAGTTKEQIHVQEMLRNRLFTMKAHMLRKTIVDSLKSKYTGSE